MMSILSPRSILPEESASSRATATLAAEVLPFLEIHKHLILTRPSRSPMALMMRWLA